MRNTLLAVVCAACTACSGTQVLRFQSAEPRARVSLQRKGGDADVRSVPARYEARFANETGPVALNISGAAFLAAGLAVVAYEATPNSGGFTELFSIPLLSGGATLLGSGLL
jgi:hypothetical protein